MSINRAKIEKAAQKFAQKGNFRKAIAEYKKLLAEDANDTRTRQKVFDLYGRLGMKDEAVDECRRVAETYLEKGFNLRAIAVWKQALRIAPDNPGLHREMGELYIQQKLAGDALSSYKRAVDLLRKEDRSLEALELLGRMEEMAPANVAVKINIAEIYLEQGQFEEFSEQLGRIIQQLKGEGRARQLLQTLESFYRKSGKRIELVRPLAELLVELSEEEKALTVINEGMAVVPGDRELRLLAIRAYLALGKLLDARTVALSIRKESSEDLFILEKLASIAEACGDTKELVDWYKELAQLHGRQGQTSQEEHYYRKVLEINPADADAKLAVGGLEVRQSQEISQSQQTSQEPSRDSVELPCGDDFFIDLADDFDDAMAPEKSTTPGGQQVADGLVEVDLYLKYGLEDKAEAKLLDRARLEPGDLDIQQRMRDIHWRRGERTEWVQKQLTIAKLFLDRESPQEALRAFEAILEVEADNVQAREGIRNLRPDPVGPPAPYQEPPTLDMGIALEPTDMSEGEPALPDVDDGEFHIPIDDAITMGEPEAAPAEAPEAEEMTHGELDLASMDEIIKVGAPMATDPTGGGQAALGDIEIPEELFTGGEASSEPAPPPPPTQPPPQQEDGFSVASSIAGFEDVESSELADIVKEFKTGVAEKLDESDFETHYNLGVAYKEMGLVEEALQEFQKAARFPEKSRTAFTSISMIQRDLGQLAEARASLRQALSVPTNTPEERAAILYELGALAEFEQDWESALNAYDKAAGIDPAHRDVSTRIQHLRARLGG